MRIQSTADIPLDVLAGINAELPSSLRGEVDQRQAFFKSAEPPSWVAFVAELPWWMKALGAYAAIFAAELTKEAAKETWRNRRRVVEAVGRVPQLVTAPVVRAFVRLRGIVGPRTSIDLGLPVPDDYFGTRMRLEGRSPAELATELCLFLHHLPGLADLLAEQGLDRQRVTGQITLDLLDDGSLEVSWMDRKSLDVVKMRLPPLDAG